MQNVDNAAVKTTEPREISATRNFNAPRSLVWSAWNDPERIGQWWGPIGFTTTTSVFDFRPGGKWVSTMHGPDGTDYPNEVTYTAIVENELIEYMHGPSPVFHVTIRFEDNDIGGTMLSMRMLFGTKEERDRIAEEFGAVEGLEQTMGRLEEFLATQ